ncbi:MAG: 3-oxoacyl-[acyl-carrier-protein] reductase [bacterium]
MARLTERVAIITGGAQGIGRAAVEVFTREGAKVIIWDVQDSAAEAANEMTDKGFPVEFQKVDISDFNAVQDAANRIVEKYRKIDILVNNAGVIRDSSFLKMTPEQWQKVLDVNLTGVFNCVKAVAPHMVAQKYGRIVNTSSISGLRGNFGQANYAATKAGIIGMTKTLAREFGKHGITVNSVAPGFIASEMTDSIPEEMRQASIAAIPVKRAGLPEDIAHAYLFLASDEASFVSGHCLSVNGGVL